MKKHTHWKNAKTKSVTILPQFILKMKGKFDGNKGIGVVDATIDKLYKKEAAIEAAECIACEKCLYEPRKTAAKLLKVIENAEKRLTGMPVNIEGAGSDIVRSNRRNTSNKTTAIACISSGTENLCEINQDIVSCETILEERIKKLRNKTSAKIHSYISGVRTVIQDYNSNCVFDDSAMVIYNERHADLDNEIKCKVVNFSSKEVF